MVVELIVQKFSFTLLILIADILSILIRSTNYDNQLLLRRSSFKHYDDKSSIELDTTTSQSQRRHLKTSLLLLVDAKGVAGIGKVGGDQQGGSDKAGQQVPPEVYHALTYAGTAFLFTLSVPVILYGLNKVLNTVEDCFGCGPSSKKKAITAKQGIQNQIEQQRQSKLKSQHSVSEINGNMPHLSQQQSIGPQTDSTAITLPLNYTLNYNLPSVQQNPKQMQHNHQHNGPYIISSPHL